MLSTGKKKKKRTSENGCGGKATADTRRNKQECSTCYCSKRYITVHFAASNKANFPLKLTSTNNFLYPTLRKPITIPFPDLGMMKKKKVKEFIREA